MGFYEFGIPSMPSLAHPTTIPYHHDPLQLHHCAHYHNPMPCGYSPTTTSRARLLFWGSELPGQLEGLASTLPHH